MVLFWFACECAGSSEILVIYGELLDCAMGREGGWKQSEFRWALRIEKEIIWMKH